MTERSVKCGMDKRKVCVFLILVGVGIVCVCALMYMLFYAAPHSNSTIKNGPHSLVRHDTPRFASTLAAACFVHS